MLLLISKLPWGKQHGSFVQRDFPCRHIPRKSNFLLEFSLKIMKRKNIYFYNTKHLFLLLNLFKIQFTTKNFLAKFFIEVHRFRLIHQKLNSKYFLRPLVATHLFKIQFPTKNFPVKFLINMHRFWLIHQKLNSKGFFPIPGSDTLVQNSNSYKKFSIEIFIKVHKFRFIHQNLNSKGYFRTLVVTLLLKIQFPTKKGLAD